MKRIDTQATDAATREAWEANWAEIPMERILGIFTYERVRRQMELFMRVLPKNERILEGGCGLAPYVIELRRRGLDVEGVDYNEAPLRKALAYDPSLPLRQADVAALPYADDSFGGYLSLGVIEHFSEGPAKA
ncbi:MAG: class I SAM-dependent methyltransferase, partial [Candidatus Omnitrophica bacterium]|nr:class I SAM-dependent methyltransferase [Candidatus Omnitrophota bacterium]